MYVIFRTALVRKQILFRSFHGAERKHGRIFHRKQTYARQRLVFIICFRLAVAALYGNNVVARFLRGKIERIFERGNRRFAHRLLSAVVRQFRNGDFIRLVHAERRPGNFLFAHGNRGNAGIFPYGVQHDVFVNRVAFVIFRRQLRFVVVRAVPPAEEFRSVLFSGLRQIKQLSSRRFTGELRPRVPGERNRVFFRA